MSAPYSITPDLPYRRSACPRSARAFRITGSSRNWARNLASTPALTNDLQKKRPQPLHQKILWAGISIFALILFGVLWTVYSNRSGQSKLQETVTRIEQSARAGRLDESFALIRQVGLECSDRRLRSIAGAICGAVSIEAQPPARAKVRRVYTSGAPRLDAPQDLGVTPILSKRLVGGEYVLTLQAEAYTPLALPLRVSTDHEARLDRKLMPSGGQSEGMVLIPEGTSSVGGGVSVASFLIGSCEVTNAQYARFLAAGRYANLDYWRELPGSDTTRKFVDRTGLPGPRRWSNGTYPRGEQDHPVTGVTWYEAKAYARWSGKDLPTLAQWWRAAIGDAKGGYPWGEDLRMDIRANFGLPGATALGSYPAGVSPFGCFDMAGNVREWILLQKPDRPRVGVVGGSWADPSYMFEPSHLEFFDPLYENDRIGFRLAAPVSAAKDK
jgi:hypothetical protein